MYDEPSLAETKSETDFLDSRVERFARSLAQRNSRRSFLGWAGKMLIAFTSAAVLVPTLPADRRVNTVEATTACTYWAYCYMDGYPCANCGGSDTSCPGGCTGGNYWTQCCQNPSDFCFYNVAYTDCCGCTVSCSGTFCNNSSQSSWCGNAGSYACTLAHVATKCNIACVQIPSRK
jgi:hypothetical protein